MSLAKKFNELFIKNLEIVNQCFQDMSRTEEKALDELVAETKCVVAEDMQSKVYYNMFVEQVTQDIEDAMYTLTDFKKPESCPVLNKDQIPFLAKIQFNIIWKRLLPAERKVFVSNFLDVCRHAHLIQTCGDGIEEIERVARKHAPKNGITNPEDSALNSNVLKDLLGSKAFIQKISEPGSIKSMLSNLQGVIRTSASDQGAGHKNDLFDVVRMGSELANEAKDGDALGGQSLNMDELKQAANLIA